MTTKDDYKVKPQLTEGYTASLENLELESGRSSTSTPKQQGTGVTSKLIAKAFKYQQSAKSELNRVSRENLPLLLQAFTQIAATSIKKLYTPQKQQVTTSKKPYNANNLKQNSVSNTIVKITGKTFIQTFSDEFNDPVITDPMPITEHGQTVGYHVTFKVRSNPTTGFNGHYEFDADFKLNADVSLSGNLTAGLRYKHNTHISGYAMTAFAYERMFSQARDFVLRNSNTPNKLVSAFQKNSPPAISVIKHSNVNNLPTLNTLNSVIGHHLNISDEDLNTFFSEYTDYLIDDVGDFFKQNQAFSNYHTPQVLIHRFASKHNPLPVEVRNQILEQLLTTTGSTTITSTRAVDLLSQIHGTPGYNLTSVGVHFSNIVDTFLYFGEEDEIVVDAEPLNLSKAQTGQETPIDYDYDPLGINVEIEDE